MSELTKTIQAALDNLAAIPTWRSMVAENIGSGGIERLVQNTLLWSINSVSTGRFLANADKRIPVADREAGKTRSGEKEIDLVIFPRTETASSDWWAVWEMHKSSHIPTALAAMCSGFVELKPTHLTGYLSGRPTWAAGAVDHDIHQMRAAQTYSHARGQMPKELFELLLLVGCNPLDARCASVATREMAHELGHCENIFWETVTTVKRDAKISEHWLLTEEPYSSDPRRKMYLKAVLIDAREGVSSSTPPDQGPASMLLP